MDKTTGEEDFKGLEEEIDKAVDRLFVENRRGMAKSVSTESPLLDPSLKSIIQEPSVGPPASQGFMESSLFEPSMESPILEPSTPSPVLEPSTEPSVLEPSYEIGLEKNFDSEESPRPPSAAVPFSKSIEAMEAQLLSLEWEISEEKLRKTREEVLALREVWKHRADFRSILGEMEEVLSHMIENEEDIRPSWIKFLLDSKETIKLLTRKETAGEINIYKQLAHMGIEARFSCLEGMKHAKIIQPSFGRGDGVEKAEVSIPGEKKIEDISNKMNLFMEQAEEMFRTMKQQISRLEETNRKSTAPSLEAKPKSVNVTIFKVDEKLFGVESEKVFKLFRVPSAFQERYANQEKIRVRDFEIKMINLKKIFAMQGSVDKGDTKILAVRDNGEYKGFLVDQVVKKISSLSEKEGQVGKYFSGVIHFTYQEQSVEIPILDLKKF